MDTRRRKLRAIESYFFGSMRGLFPADLESVDRPEAPPEWLRSLGYE